MHVGWEERREPRRGGGGRATFAINTVNNVNSGISSSSPNAGSLTFSVRIRRRLSDVVQLVSLKYVKLGYHYLLALGIYLATMPLPLLVPVFSAEVGSLSREELWAGVEGAWPPD